MTDTPSSHSVLANSAIPPGLSETVTENFTRRPSAARPLSKHRPRIVVSIFPPHNGITTLEKFKHKFRNIKIGHARTNYMFNVYLRFIDIALNIYFFPASSGTSPARTAATPDAPPPSTTAFSISTKRRMAIAIHSSDTVTILSIRGARIYKKISTMLREIKINYTPLYKNEFSRFVPAVAKALHPTVGTVRPSARLGCVGAFTGVPALIASIKL